MDILKYFIEIQVIKKELAKGMDADLGIIKEKLDFLRAYKPCRLEFMLAEIEYMLMIGEDKKQCRNALHGIAQEYEYNETMSDFFRIEGMTYDDDLCKEACRYSENLYKGSIDTCDIPGTLDRIRELFLSSKITSCKDDLIMRLAEEYFIVRNYTLYFMLTCLWLKRNKLLDEHERYIRRPIGTVDQCLNIGYLLKQILSEEKYIYIVYGDYKNNLDLKVIAKCIIMLGGEAVVVQSSNSKTHENISLSKSIAASIDTAIIDNGVLLIESALFGSDEEFRNDFELIRFIAGSVQQKCAPVVFATDREIDQIQEHGEIGKNFERLSVALPDQFSYCISFAWAGKYTDYIGYVYDLPVAEMINRPSEVDISVVIPVRNNAETLEYTLKTCLNQNFSGTYEIIVSDNSDNDYNDVYQLCECFNDEHIVYLKTPFILELPKSFEYAFLHARGEFIFSMGADDGLFPWSLQDMQNCVSEMKEYNVLRWERDFYAWPEFNYGQQNQLTVHVYGKDHKIHMDKINGAEFLKLLLSDPRGMLYRLPLLYINSGFKRKFLLNLLKKYGRLWDGSSQDVYMGIVSLLEDYYHYYTPSTLTIAGASKKSIGLNSQCFDDNLLEMANHIKKNDIYILHHIGEYSKLRDELQVVCNKGLDIQLVYLALIRIAALGDVNAKYIIDKINWNKLYDDYFINSIKSSDVECDKMLNMIQYAVSRNDGLKKYAGLINKVYPVTVGEVCYSYERTYKVGYFQEEGEFVWNAAGFGITNVAEAVEFINKVFNE